MAHGLDDVAGAGLALRADHRRALADAPQRLAQIAAAADERHLEVPLVDVVRLVGRRQHLGFVDVVDAQRLQHLRLDEVADAHLGHDRDAHRVHDALDDLRVGHAGHAAAGADVGRHPFERHDGAGPGLLRDRGVLRRDDVHDDAALEHLRQAALNGIGSGFDRHGAPPSSGNPVYGRLQWARKRALRFVARTGGRCRLDRSRETSHSASQRGLVLS